MKPLTTSVYTFSNLIEGGFLYVDKTNVHMHTPLPQLVPQRVARIRREVAAVIWRKGADVPVQGSPVLPEPVDESAARQLRYEH